MSSFRNALAFMCLVTLVFSIASPAQGDDSWPQFRGPNRDGKSTETGLVKDWKENTPSLLWRSEGLGKGFASLAIQNGMAYTAGDREDGFYVVASDLNEQGEERWATKIGSVYDLPSGYPGSRTTPTIDGDRMFVVNFDGSVCCLNCQDGELIWKFDYRKELGVKAYPQWGFSESVLVDGDHILCTPGNSKAMVVALDKQTGKRVWKLDLVAQLEQRGIDVKSYFVEERSPNRGRQRREEPSKDELVEQLTSLDDSIQKEDLKDLSMEQVQERIQQFYVNRTIEYILENSDAKREDLEKLSAQEIFQESNRLRRPQVDEEEAKSKLIAEMVDLDSSLKSSDLETIGYQELRGQFQEMSNKIEHKNFAGYSSMMISHAGGVRHYVVWTDVGLLGVSPGGDLLWYWKEKGGTSAGTPIIHEDYVFSSGGSGSGCVLLKLEAGADAGSVSVSEVYRKEDRQTFSCHFGSVILVDGKIYYGHGRGLPSCLDFGTGEQTWAKARGAGSGSVAATYADGHLYLRYADGTMELVETGTDQFESKGSFSIPAEEENQSWSRPVIHQGTLLLRTQDGSLLCYDVKEKN